MTSSLVTDAAQVDFDAIAGIYDAVFPTHVTAHYLRRRSRYLLSLCAAAGTKALDVGAGTGHLAERLAERGVEVVALDPFPQMLAQLEQRRPEIATVVAPAEAIPFPDGAFDLTYSVATLHHIAGAEQVRRALAEMVRVTRPGGKIVVWDHNPLNPYWPLLMRRVPQDNGSERLVPLREIADGLRVAGAGIVRAQRLGLVPEFVPRRLMAVAAGIERAVEAAPGLNALCAHNVVLAVKR